MRGRPNCVWPMILWPLICDRTASNTLKLYKYMTNQALTPSHPSPAAPTALLSRSHEVTSAWRSGSGGLGGTMEDPPWWTYEGRLSGSGGP